MRLNTYFGMRKVKNRLNWQGKKLLFWALICICEIWLLFNKATYVTELESYFALMSCGTESNQSKYHLLVASYLPEKSHPEDPFVLLALNTEHYNSSV